MIPRADAEQSVLSSRIEITPTAWTHGYTDYFATGVVAVEIHEPPPRRCGWSRPRPST